MVGDEYRPKQKTCNRAQTNHKVYPCAATVLDPDRRNSVGQQQSDIQWSRVPGYVMGQVVGGVLAALFLRVMFGTVAALGATVPGSGIGNGKALAMEVLLTTGLVNTILGTASGARNIGTNGAIAVGGYIVLAGLWAAPITGASMNPARSFAPDLVRGDFGTTWIYLVGPAIGALIGVIFEWILKGRPTAAGAIAAQGSRDGDDLTNA